MMNTQDIEIQLKNIPLKFIPTRNNKVEWGMKLPMFVDTFNSMIENDKRIPSQDEFVIRYFQNNATEITDIISDPELKNGLEARLRRTYPSFVRDVYFLALLRERGLDVLYDQKSDIVLGVDHIIRYKGQMFFIHCFVKTRLGQLGRKIKNNRHDFKGIHLDIEMDLGSNSAKKVGDFRMYSNIHIDHLLEMMDAEIAKII